MVSKSKKSNGHTEPTPEMRAAMAKQLRAATTSELLQRFSFMRQAGLGFDGARDYYEVLGYDRVITTKQYRDEYARGGIAKRIVEAFPKATWRGGVELFEDEDPEKSTEFEKAWDSINQRLNVWNILYRADVLAGLSTFSVILIGAEGELDKELPKGNPDKLLYLTPFLGGGSSLNNRNQMTAIDTDAAVSELEIDTASKRFGEPKTYQLKRLDITSLKLTKPIHWSRIIHIAEGCLDDNINGQPTLENIWNLLQDLLKVTGGGAEAFWLRGNQGMHLNIDPAMSLEDTKNTVESLREQAEAYKHQITRWMRTRGVEINTLGSDVANFGPSAEAILTQIAGSKGIPMRILTGSERGELASSQDAANFNTQVYDRRTGYAGPMIVRRLVDRLIEYGYLPKPIEYDVKWAEIETMSEIEKAQGAKAWADVNAASMDAIGQPVYTGAEIREHWTGLEPLDDAAVQEVLDAKKALLEATTPEPPEPVAVPAPAPAPAKEPFPRAAMSGPHSLASTQIQLPPALAAKIFDVGRQIPDAELAEMGREDDAHITVKYGLKSDNVEEIRDVLADAGPIQVTLGPLAVFSRPEHDVLYASVDSPTLHTLNSRIDATVETEPSEFDYTPHATIAYLKPGEGAKYAGNMMLDGETATVSSVLFSPSQGDQKILVSTLRAAELNDPELLRILADAEECGATEVVEAIRAAGGPGSGHHGHSGRKGEVGGSTKEGDTGLGYPAPMSLFKTRSFQVSELGGARRFMLHPKTGTAVFGALGHDPSSGTHAEDLANSGAKEPFDSFERGWISAEDKELILFDRAEYLAADNIETIDAEDRRYEALQRLVSAGMTKDWTIAAPDDAGAASFSRPLGRAYPELFKKMRGLGGAGSGHHGHKGRPGEEGGSAKEGDSNGAPLNKSDEARITKWISAGGGEPWNVPTDKAFQRLRDPKTPQGKAMAVTLDKLPAFEGTGFRGINLSDAELAKLSEQRTMVLSKHDSFSTNRGQAEEFVNPESRVSTVPVELSSTKVKEKPSWLYPEGRIREDIKWGSKKVTAGPKAKTNGVLIKASGVFADARGIFGSGEDEIIAKAGSRFTVDKISKVRGTTIIHVSQSKMRGAEGEEILIDLGGPGSGHHGHEGRPGQVGGSSAEGGSVTNRSGHEFRAKTQVMHQLIPQRGQVQSIEDGKLRVRWEGGKEEIVSPNMVMAVNVETERKQHEAAAKESSRERAKETEDDDFYQGFGPLSRSEPGSVKDLPVYRGGVITHSAEVTYHTTNREMAESYVQMSNDRFGEGGALHESKLTIDKPAPEAVIQKIAKSVGIDNAFYTPASVFDAEIHGKGPVKELVTELKKQGYDGTVLTDIAYGKEIEDKAYIKFRGATDA
jgi:hypothetical protein